MTNKHRINVDLGALVDIISNVAGMMVLLACVAMIVRQNTDTGYALNQAPTKPISFPLAYIPNKRSITVCLKYGKLYELPEKELLDAVTEKSKRGEAVEWLSLSSAAAEAVVSLTPTTTGFRFQYKLKPTGGVDLRASDKIVETLDDMIKQFPPSRFFYVFHTWPESFEQFREVREYLLESGVEVGWVPRNSEQRNFDIIYSMGEYDENLTTIKAQ